MAGATLCELIVANKSPVIAIGNEARDLERELRMVGRRHDLWRTWSDFCEIHALALSNACDLRQQEEREARYLEIVKQYERDEIEAFARCAGLVALALNRNPHQDFLGHMFMNMELGNVKGLGHAGACVRFVVA